MINIPKHSGEEELANDYVIRRKSADFGIPLITNLQLAQRFVEALARKRLEELEIKSWQEYGGVVPSDPQVSTALRIARAKVAGE